MTYNMLRGHSGRLLLGMCIFPSNKSTSAASPKSSIHRLSSVATHNNSRGWKPLQRISIAPANVAAPILLGRSNQASAASNAFACTWGQLGSRESLSSTATSLSFRARGVLSRRFASAESGGGNGSGTGNRGGGGGSGGGKGNGGGSSNGAGDDGRWRIWAWYLGLLDKNPILTKAVTSAVLTFIGDVFCQYYLEKAENLDGKRVAVMTFLGFGLVGPTLHFWYSTLSKLVTVAGPAGVGIRLVLDQFVFSPTFIATFISCLMTLEGNPKQITAKLKQDWWSAVRTNWQLWIPAQIINFWLVPLKLQVAFANCIALVWNAYLSWKSHLEVAAPQGLISEAKAS